MGRRTSHDTLNQAVDQFASSLRAAAMSIADEILRQELARRQQHRSPPRAPTWTRETIITELVSLLRSGTSIDAAFVQRHGPRGLVGATRKTFGRFEAAMNVASLRVSQLYPEGGAR